MFTGLMFTRRMGILAEPLAASALDQLFLTARTYNTWSTQPVSEETLHRLWDLVKMAPTSANCAPARLVFVTTPDGKARLRPTLAEGNVEKTMQAPVTVLVAYDTLFYDHLPKLFPHTDARSWFAGNQALAEETAFRNSTLQGAYVIMAARSLGLDCGPMSGFDTEKVNSAFFPDGRCKINFMCNLGYGTSDSLYPRSPRFDFSEACQLV